MIDWGLGSTDTPYSPVTRELFEFVRVRVRDEQLVLSTDKVVTIPRYGSGLFTL